ncbi:hypothetical protein M408DRAFT_331693 [Serendipita vermifera MAFF 305830]|uniref:phosphoribosylglycinamide formyltransferase 1 n=1 Tax=Serendipita vermifera MAFF 305830 TaxID=933852 RepID=A0A0C2X626_SERVB|nr:hypothetical protein M408DRAFT_331693 [Serendipita vermifera MAFF 305830]
MSESAEGNDSLTPLRIAVLISGSGTNLQALIDAQPSFETPANIVLVLSNRKAAYGLTRASNAQPPIPTAYLALQPYLKSHPGHTRDDYDREVGKMVLEAKPDLVVLAGWMHVFGDGFLDLMAGSTSRPEAAGEQAANADPLQEDSSVVFPIPVINLHPALPGQFDGANAIDRAWAVFHSPEPESRITHTGVMVHRVVRQVDAGEPILVERVLMSKDDTKQQFEERLHAVEWKLIVWATEKVLKERTQQRWQSVRAKQ